MTARHGGGSGKTTGLHHCSDTRVRDSRVLLINERVRAKNSRKPTATVIIILLLSLATATAAACSILFGGSLNLILHTISST